MPEQGEGRGAMLAAPLRTRYFSNVGRRMDRISPDDFPIAIGVLADVDRPGSIIGVAYGAGHLGGWRTDFSGPGYPSEDLGPREAVWRLVVAKVEVEGRFVLRMGEFVELAEDATRNSPGSPSVG